MVYGKKKLEDSKLFKKSRSIILLPEGNKSEHFSVFTTILVFLLLDLVLCMYIYFFKHIYIIYIYTHSYTYNHNVTMNYQFTQVFFKEFNQFYNFLLACHTYLSLDLFLRWIQRYRHSYIFSVFSNNIVLRFGFSGYLLLLHRPHIFCPFLLAGQDFWHNDEQKW